MSGRLAAQLWKPTPTRARPLSLLDVSENTMSRYKKRWPAVAAACNAGKTDVRRRIALTLYELALGAEGWQNNPALRQPDHTAAILRYEDAGGLV